MFFIIFNASVGKSESAREVASNIRSSYAINLTLKDKINYYLVCVTILRYYVKCSDSLHPAPELACVSSQLYTML